MANKSLNLTLKIYRQDGPGKKGRMVTYPLKDVSVDMSFLEMLDMLNEQLIAQGQRPIEFESDCREGICGSCGLVINGQPHGPLRATATCQLHMRSFSDGDEIYIEPWKASAFSVIRDLVVDRSALDRIIAAGGYTSAKAGPHADANCMLVPKDDAEKAMDAAACIGCGACVAACPNASVSLFTAAKVTQMRLLPQGHPERDQRVERMVAQMDEEGFGNCTNIGECQAACPKDISIETIRTLKAEYLRVMLK